MKWPLLRYRSDITKQFEILYKCQYLNHTIRLNQIVYTQTIPVIFFTFSDSEF